MCLWILTDETNELIVRSNIRHVKHVKHTERLNPSFIINPDILIDQYIQIQDTNKKGKSIKYKGQIKEKINDNEYRIELSNGKQKLLDIRNKLRMMGIEIKKHLKYWEITKQL